MLTDQMKAASVPAGELRAAGATDHDARSRNRVQDHDRHSRVVVSLRRKAARPRGVAITGATLTPSRTARCLKGQRTGV